MEQKESMSRRDALKTMGVIVATAALSTTGLSAFAAPAKKDKSKKRLLFYFTATGNSLFVARELVGETGQLLSIPQIIKDERLDFEADEIGFIFPDYAASAPMMVREFVSKAHFKAQYIFSVITFGNFAANVAEWWNDFCKGKGLQQNYINNLPVFDMNEQVKIDKKIPDNLAAIVDDIHGHKQFIAHYEQMDERMQGFLKRLQENHFPMEAERLLRLNTETCIACGTCAAVCPHGNFRMTDTHAEFSGSCEYCLACVHACPQKALTLERERNPQARFRNENISLRDIKQANNQHK